MSDQLFAGMRPPRAPDDLRERALRAARAAAAAPTVAVSHVRGWSRWDVVWATALLVLMVGHVVLSTRARSGAAVAAAHRPVTRPRSASERAPSREWQDVGLYLVARQVQTGPEPSLKVKGVLKEPALGGFAAE